MTTEELERSLKTGTLKSLYLLYGEEQYLLETCVKKIKKNFGDIVNGINFIQIDDRNVENIISDIETPAFGYLKKLIIVKDSGLFKKQSKNQKKESTPVKKTQKQDTLQNKIATYIESNIDTISQGVVLVFIEQEVGTNELQKTIQKLGIVCNFERLKLFQLSKRIETICLAYKVNIDDKTANYFVETCGTSLLVLINEIRKLIEYVGENGTIKNKDIDKLAIKELESSIFDLTDNLGQKNITEVLKRLNELLQNKEPIQKILITLYNHLKKIYLTILANEYNANIEETLELKANQMFLISKYKKQATYFKKEELRNILQELIELDYKTKQGLIDINIGLESILCTVT